MHNRLELALNDWQSWGLALTAKPRVLKEINQGLTNKSFLISANSQNYILRLHNTQSKQLGINRQHEKAIVDKLFNIGISPKWLYWNNLIDFTIIEHLQGFTWNYKELQKEKNQQKILETIKRYQETEIDIPHFNYAAHLYDYWKQLDKNGSRFCTDMKYQWMDFYKRLNNWQAKQTNQVLCHHDLTPENILETKQGIKIIDWEYSGRGHREFDAIRLLRDPDGNIEHPIINTETKNESMLTQIMFWMDSLWYKLQELRQ